MLLAAFNYLLFIIIIILLLQIWYFFIFHFSQMVKNTERRKGIEGEGERERKKEYLFPHKSTIWLKWKIFLFYLVLSFAKGTYLTLSYRYMN